jgi:hypothetical protein
MREVLDSKPELGFPSQTSITISDNNATFSHKSSASWQLACQLFAAFRTFRVYDKRKSWKAEKLPMPLI